MTDESPQNDDSAAGGLFPGLEPAPQAEKSAGYRVLARKYRPKNFEELIGQDLMVRILTNAFELGRVHQAYMLTGVRGVGKTTTARILARALNYSVPAHDGAPAIDRPTVHMPVLGEHCQAIIDSRHVDVIEMDAASHTGVDDVREIIEGAKYKPAVARTKVYIIDEVHMLSKSAFNALLKTLEEPPEHVKFIFATTEIEKVPVTVRSRCLRFDLRRVEPATLVAHLDRICRAENVAIEPDALSLISRAAEGSVRDSLSLLDQAIAHGGPGRTIPAEEVRAMLGLADKARVIEIFDALMRGEVARALEGLQQQYDEGADPAQVLTEIAEFVHLVTRAKITPDAAFAASPPEESKAAKTYAGQLAMPVLNRAWQILMKGIAEARESARPLAAADMVLVRLAYAADLPTPEDALRKLGWGAPESAGAAPAPAATGRPAPTMAATAPRAGFAGDAGAARATAMQAAPAPDSAPRASFAKFEDVIARAAAERDIQLKILLERDVRLVRFEQGQVEFSLAPGGSTHLPQVLMRRLQEWTGERWIVALSNREGYPSIAERRAEEERERQRGVAADPLVRAVLEKFPGAEIVSVRNASEAMDQAAAPAGPESADDVIYADDDESGDDD
ncbi:MAG: DNA polymerase III subunit gamma/tau [Hyphomicrobiales bacterium]|nr:DNA polymerase III subunit gamma/tau [Hyphomicrobiales bacterium]